MVLVVLAAACDAPLTDPSSGDPGGSSGGSGSSHLGTTIVITTTGVSPSTMTVGQGAQVTFTNNDAVAHDIESDPDPLGTDCPEINSVGVLNPGQSRQTASLNIARTCGYHDHSSPGVAALQGSIVVMAR